MPFPSAVEDTSSKKEGSLQREVNSRKGVLLQGIRNPPTRSLGPPSLIPPAKAGATTRYAFGDAITLEQVNYGGLLQPRPQRAPSGATSVTSAATASAVPESRSREPGKLAGGPMRRRRRRDRGQPPTVIDAPEPAQPARFEDKGRQFSITPLCSLLSVIGTSGGIVAKIA
jgi:hypothetical protein